MFRFPLPSLSWRWVSRSGKKKKNDHIKGSECQWRPGCSVRKLGYVDFSFAIDIRWYNRNRTTRLQKRSIDDNLRQLIGVKKTSSWACRLKYSLLYKWFCFLFYFSKKMGRSGDGKRNILRGWSESKKKNWKLTEFRLNCKERFTFLQGPISDNRFMSVDAA